MLAAVVAGLAFIGSVTGVELLAKFLPRWPSIAPVTLVAIVGTAVAFRLLLPRDTGHRFAGFALLAAVALAVLALMFWPGAERFPGGAVSVYPGGALLLLLVGTALATVPGEKHVPATRLLAFAAAVLMFIALVGTGFRLLLALPPLVQISLPAILALVLLSYAAVVARPDDWLIERLTSARPGAVMTRRLLPAILLLPFVIGLTELVAESYGLLDSAVGSVLQTLITMFALGALTVWGAATLDRLDARRSEAEHALQSAFAELDVRVNDRTAALARANTALHESGALLRGVAESTPDLIVVKDSAGRVMMSNPAHIKAVGKPEASVVGCTDVEFMADAALAARIMENDRNVMSSGRVERVEQTIATPDGLRTYLATKSPLRDVDGKIVGVIEVATDISERKRMENELREAQGFTQGLVETAPIILYLFDSEQHRLVYVNGMGLQSLGFTPADLLAKDRSGLESLVHPDDLPLLLDRLRRGPDAQPGIREVEFRFRAGDGEWRWLHGREREFEPGTGNRLILGIAVDITDRKNAELERERLMAAEQRLRVEAERANRAKDEFLAIVSHELRSPLNALRGWGFLLGSAKVPDADLIERATQAIKRNVDHQARLIDDLLDTSRIMSGKLNIERQPVNLVEVLQGALDVVRASALAKRVALEFQAPRSAVMLEGDAARLHQVAVNLLSNAVKFTPEGGGVRVNLHADGSAARIIVADTGAGIDPEFLPRVFDRFSQADTSTTRTHGGLGIGLALVRHLTELHGGRVSARSEGAGKGAIFSVELPRAEAREPAAEAAPPGSDAKPAHLNKLAGVHICALDDDADARDVITLTLRQAGAEVRTLSTGSELIAMLDKDLPKVRPDVLLMDLAMPGEDGFAVLARVRALERRKKVPLRSSIPAIAVTAFTDVSRSRVLEQGFVDHVSKPIHPAKLVASIRRAVSDAKKRKADAGAGMDLA